MPPGFLPGGYFFNLLQYFDMKLKLFLVGMFIIVGTAVGFGVRQIHKTVRIEVDGNLTEINFWGFSVQEALTAAQIPITEGDLVDPPLNQNILTGELIQIFRAAWVIVQVDESAVTLWTADRDPLDLIHQASFEVKTGDQIFWEGQLIAPETELPYQSSHYLEIKRATPITVTIDHQTQTIYTTVPTLAAALLEADIDLNESDQVIPALDTPLTGEPLQVEIQRASRVVIRTGETEIEDQVVAATVGEALAAAEMGLQGLDYSIPAPSEPIPASGRIQVVRVREEILLEQDLIPFGFEERTLPDVDLDTRQVVQTGEYGITARRIRVVYEDEVEVSREVEAEWIAKYPQPRIEGYGTKISVQSAQTADGPIQYYRKMDVYATSYSPCNIGIPGQCGTHTASGKVPQKGMIAVIRSWYNQMRGQAVYVTGYGFATIEDIGAGFSDRHWIDLAWTDEEYAGWSGWVTLYFLAPVPANVMWVLE